jgi:N-carbamoyl-L-amino-acid hydrolase
MAGRFAPEFLLLAVLASGPLLAAAPEDLRVNAGRLEARILELGTFGANPDGGVSRLAFSDSDLQGREYLMGLMREADLEVTVDAAGNIIGRREGSDPSLMPILFGSHSDSVPEGGNYDGQLGVLGGIEVAQVLAENQVTTRHPLEVIVFVGEEAGLIGSKSFIGHLDEAMLEEKSQSGFTIAEGIRRLGGDPDRLESARREAGQYTAYLELHIEQGGVLEAEGIDIGVVEGIVGIDWWDMIVEGKANHAGTTPMDSRRDAMVAAAELVLAVNRIIISEPGNQVGTVGRIQAEPGAPNVIPGRVVASLEIRDLSNERILHLFEKIEAEARQIATRTGTGISFRKSPIHEVAAMTDVRIREAIAGAARRLGYTRKSIPSGAGHDAQAVASIMPVGMIFVPSVGGVSHSPAEFTRPEDMAKGANVLMHTILAIDLLSGDGASMPD